jgi:hypothetical protein
MAPLGPAQERQAVSKTGYTLEQLVEAAAASRQLLRRLPEDLYENAAAAAAFRAHFPIGGLIRTPEGGDGSEEMSPIASNVVKRLAGADRKRMTVVELFKSYSEQAEIGAGQHKLSADPSPLTDLRVTLTEMGRTAALTQDQIHKAHVAAERILMESAGLLAAEQSAEPPEATDGYVPTRTQSTKKGGARGSDSAGGGVTAKRRPGRPRKRDPEEDRILAAWESRAHVTYAECAWELKLVHVSGLPDSQRVGRVVDAVRKRRKRGEQRRTK